MVYAVLREQGMRRWRVAATGAELTPRLLVLADAATPLHVWRDLCGNGTYAPPALDETEITALSKLPSDEDAPLWARANLPPEVAEMVQATFGADTEMELAALNGRAPLDLRVKHAAGKSRDGAGAAACRWHCRGLHADVAAGHPPAGARAARHELALPRRHDRTAG